MENYAPLRVTLNKLLYNHPDTIDQFEGFTELEIQSIRDDYSAEEIRIIATAVITVCEKNDLNFLAFMPELSEFQYTNEQVHAYLMKIQPVFSTLIGQ